MGENFILFANNLYESYGGVADYTDNFAIELNRKDRLMGVVYNNRNTISVDRKFELYHFDLDLQRPSSIFDRFKPASKIFTLQHRLLLYSKAIKRLRKVRDKFPNCTIIFTEYYSFSFDIIIYAARLLKMKYSILFHGLDIIWAKQHNYLHFKKNVENASFVIFNSQSTKRLLEKKFSLKLNSYEIIHPGLPSDRLGKDVEEKVYTDTIVFASVSRLVPRKGIDHAIRIIQGVHSIYPNIHYYIAGTGSELSKLEELVKSIDATGYISFCGVISEEQKFELLGKSHFFLMPNYSMGENDIEGFGISFIEASLMKNVIIGGLNGGSKEAVVNNKTGFLFDFEDNESIRTSINLVRSLLQNKAEISRIGENGHLFVKQAFNWKNLAEKFLSFTDNQVQ